MSDEKRRDQHCEGCGWFLPASKPQYWCPCCQQPLCRPCYRTAKAKVLAAAVVGAEGGGVLTHGDDEPGGKP